MPEHWYSARACKASENDEQDTLQRKERWMQLVADHKPYFMVYVYPPLLNESRKYEKSVRQKLNILFRNRGIQTVDDLMSYTGSDDEIKQFQQYYVVLNPIGQHHCTMNRITWYLESAFAGINKKIDALIAQNSVFDYHILQCNSGYTKTMYQHVASVYQTFMDQVWKHKLQNSYKQEDPYDLYMHHKMMNDYFESECYRACTNEDCLCDIVVDMCYRPNHAKQFAWDVCGRVMLSNLLERNDHIISFPVLSTDPKQYDFLYAESPFVMSTLHLGGEED